MAAVTQIRGSSPLPLRRMSETKPLMSPSSFWVQVPRREVEMRRSATRAATAMMVSAGLALPWVGSTLPSVM